MTSRLRLEHQLTSEFNEHKNIVQSDSIRINKLRFPGKSVFKINLNALNGTFYLNFKLKLDSLGKTENSESLIMVLFMFSRLRFR